MEFLTEEQRRNVIFNFFIKNAHLGKMFTVNHYLNEGISRKSILKTYEERNSILRKPGSGGRNASLSKASTAAVVRNNMNKKGFFKAAFK